ncbi:MAG: hypothetical protein ACXABU_06810 [Candidatus Hodarchaeales archaeon]|jgi:hypothetical protein
MVLHAPSIHFHIGAWFVTAICTSLALVMNLFQKREILNFHNRINEETVQNLDFAAHVGGLIGLGGILVASYLGLIDASGVDFHLSLTNIEGILDTILFFFDLSVPIQGLEKAMNQSQLGYKVVWTVVGMQLYLISGIIRFYFVSLKKIKISETHFGIQSIYSGAAVLGFFMMVSISATGGIYTFNESFLTDIPVLNNLLPGHEIPLLQLLTIFFGFFVLIMILFTIVSTIRSEK